MGTLRDVLGITDQRRARAATADAALGRFDIGLPGGGSVLIDPVAGGGAINLGALDPVRLGLLQSIQGSLNGGSMLPQALIDAAGGADAALASPSGTGATGLSPQFLQALQQAGGNRLATAGATASQVSSERLRTLREQAAPYERRMIQGEVQNLFNRGRFGARDSQTSLTAEAVTDALSRADLGRVVEAQNLGQQTQAQAVSEALGLFGAADQGIGNQFQRTLMSTNFNDSRAAQRFDIAQQLFGLQQGTQGADLERALAALGGVQSIDTGGLNQFMAALNAAVGKSNAGLGQASNFAGLAQNTPLLDIAGGLGAAFIGRGK